MNRWPHLLNVGYSGPIKNAAVISYPFHLCLRQVGFSLFQQRQSSGFFLFSLHRVSSLKKTLSVIVGNPCLLFCSRLPVRTPSSALRPLKFYPGLSLYDMGGWRNKKTIYLSEVSVIALSPYLNQNGGPLCLCQTDPI